MEHCAKCQTCSEACHIYEESGDNELYRPIYRSEILRRIYYKYIKKASPAVHGDIDLNWKTVARLIELAYRCNLCRRCAQTCPDRRRQRAAGPRDPQDRQPGDGHRRQGAARGRLGAPAEGRVLHRHERPGGQGQHRVHRRGHRREDRHRGRDALGQGGRRHPAHPQRRRDHGLAREPRRLRDALRSRRPELDPVQRARGLRRHQLRRLVRRRAVRPGRRSCTRRRPRSSASRRSCSASAATPTRR